MARTDPRRLARLYAKIIALPVLAFAGAVLTDWAYASSMTLQWSNFSGWLLLFGLVGGMAALLVLALSAWTAGRGWPGVGLLTVGIGAEIANLMVHMRDGFTAVVPLGMTLSIAGALIVAAAAWLTRSSEQEALA